MMWFNSQNAIHTPFSANASINGANRDIANFTPFCHRMRNTIPCQFTSNFTVTRLLSRQSPINITFFVMSIIVNAVQRMLIGRAYSNFSQKFFKRIKAHLNATFAVPMIFSILRIQTSLTRFNIRFIFRCVLSAFGIAMNCIAFSCNLTMQAPARLCMPFSQIRPAGLMNIATLALTPPLMSILLSASRISYYCQTSINMIGQIMKQFVARFRQKSNVFQCINHTNILVYYGGAWQCP